MTIEQQKEHLSNGFLGILAARRSFTLDKPALDLGVDYQLKKTYSYVKPDGKLRYTYDSRYIDLQLKATTENEVLYDINGIKYDLEVKNYNDLIERQTNGQAPLVLILFILPDDQNEWVLINPGEIKLRRNAFWYQPPAGSVPSANSATVRITIPKGNLIDSNICVTLHNLFYP